jgi:hypothetical protein
MKRLVLSLLVCLLLTGCDCSMFPGGICPNPQPTPKPPNQTDILKCAFGDKDACKRVNG